MQAIDDEVRTHHQSMRDDFGISHNSFNAVPANLLYLFLLNLSIELTKLGMIAVFAYMIGLSLSSVRRMLNPHTAFVILDRKAFEVWGLPCLEASTTENR